LFLFFLSQFSGEREGERGRLHSSLLLHSFTLSLIPIPSKGEGKKFFLKFPPFLKVETGGFIFLLFFFAKNLPLPLFKKEGN